MDKKSNKPVGTIKVSESVIVKMAELADRKSRRLNSSHPTTSRMPSSA